MTNDLAGSVWLITGASSGFGKALLDEVVSRGGHVVATARNSAALEAAVAQAPGSVTALPLDVTIQDQILPAVNAAIEKCGQIDVLVNNAGYGFLSAVEEALDSEVRDVFEVNFFGLAALTRAVLPLMRHRRRGVIVNISSVAGLQGFPSSAYYSASKFAVEGFSESLAAETGSLGIRVLIVEPGPFRTDFAGRSIAGPSRPIDAYEGAAAMRKTVMSRNGKQAGDPVRAAKIIVDTALDPAGPLHLVLGETSFDAVMGAMDAKVTDLARSREAASAADFPLDERS